MRIRILGVRSAQIHFILKMLLKHLLDAHPVHYLGVQPQAGRHSPILKNSHFTGRPGPLGDLPVCS